ncbi:sugar kinase [soil metagenome]
MKFPFHILETNDFDAVGFGTNAVDYLIRVPEYPEFNSKIELSEYSTAAGGEVASTMVGLCRLGLTTMYAGRFGSDPAGELGRKSLVDEGVDITYAETVHGAQTQVAFILIDERNGERTVIWKRDSRLAYTESDAPVEAATRGRVLHLTPHDPLACIQMATAARATGAVVSLDIDNVFPGIEVLLPLVDVCIASADFPAKLFGISDARDALIEFKQRFGCPIIGLTKGVTGSIVLCDGSFIETPGFEVDGGCVDTTGSGDAYRTGFLYGMLSGLTVEDAARSANAVASLKCRGIGARFALPDKNTLRLLLK